MSTEPLTCIGFTGKMYSGKDTAGYFFKYCLERCVHDAFANPLKEILMDHFGFTKDQMYDPEMKKEWNEEWGMTNRAAMQKLGTECIRNNFHPDAWVKVMKHRLSNNIKNNKFTIITDVRFNNEAALIQEMGGIVVEITRSPYMDFSDCNIDFDIFPDFSKWWLLIKGRFNKVFRIKDKYEDNVTHASEQGVAPEYIDLHIKNDGTIDELYEKVFNVLWVAFGEELVRTYGRKPFDLTDANTVSEVDVVMRSIILANKDKFITTK